MKKSILLFLLIVGICGTAFSQTRTVRKKTVRKTPVSKSKTKPVSRPNTKTVVKTTTKKMTETTNNNALTTDSGLTYIITKHGDGAQLKAGDTIIVNYTGMLTNGQKFDSSLDRNEPFTFPLGAGKVIKGWDEGFQKLRVGDHAILTLPASIAYGSRGAGGVIPPDATLIFIVEVLGIAEK